MDDFVFVDDLGSFKPPPASASASASHYDDMFDSYFNRSAEAPKPSPSSLPGQAPMFDKPIFDDDPDAVDPFDAIPLFGGGCGGGGEGEDFLDSLGKAAKPEGREPESAGFDDDLIPGLGGSTRSTTPVREVEQEPEAVGFDDVLIPGFGGSTKPMKPAPRVEPEVVGFDDDVIVGFGESTSHHDSTREEPRTMQEKESISSSKTSVSMLEDPFFILGATPNLGYSSFGLFTDHLDNMGIPAKSESTKFDAPSTTSGMFESTDIFGGVPKPMPSFASGKEGDIGEKRPLDDINSTSHSDRMPQVKPVQRASAEALGSVLPETHFTESSDIHEAPGTTGFQTSDPLARNLRDQLPAGNQYSKMPNDVWLTASDIVLVTQPTSAPPPSRRPPPLATKQPQAESNTSKTYSHYHNQGYHPSIGLANASKTSQIDELEDFVMAKPAKFANGHPQVLNHKGIGQDSSTAPTGFMDWAEVRPSKEVNQGGFDSMFTSSQYQQQEIDEKAEFYAYEMDNRDKEERLEHEQKRTEKEEEQRRPEREREEELEREREKARREEELEREREKARREEEFEREREKARRREEEERKRREKEKEARQAVEKAMREARERAAAEARVQAEREARQRAERAAVQRAAAEARERAAVEARQRAAKVAAEAKERAATEARERAAKVAKEAKERAAAEARERAVKAAAEARERAAVEARERAARAAAEAREKTAAESREKAAAEARRRAERAAVDRAAAEARERAAAEARARENQQRTAQPDLDSFFGVPSRSSSVPRSQTGKMNPFDVQPQGSADFGAVRKTSSGSASPFAQPPSSNAMDDLSSIFGAPSASAVFQEADGESEERRKARLERHLRTMERAAKALAEKNERDLQVQREQEERHRIGETLDFEIKRWAAGKEGNLRALLSTLQYVLWPECGWRPVSLTDLITAASVKKEYRKATLCIHPDKVQQKGANLQQKYIAEKVFDLLKEAWNKFNSEELF